jgi:hypothetical protein
MNFERDVAAHERLIVALVSNCTDAAVAARPGWITSAQARRFLQPNPNIMRRMETATALAVKGELNDESHEMGSGRVNGDPDGFAR